MAKQTSISIKRVSGVLAVAAILMFVDTPAVMALTFNDGKVHSIDYHLSEDIFVYNNVNSPHNRTTLKILNGAGVGNVSLFDDSLMLMPAGWVGGVSLYDKSSLSNSGGHIGGGIDAHDSSTATFSNGGWGGRCS